MVGWTAVNAKEAILWRDVHLHALLLFQGVVMPQLTFVFIQRLCTVVIIVYTAVMCMFVHRGSGIILPVHCIRCTLYATFPLKSMHIGAPYCMYAKFWSLHSRTHCFKGFQSSCWASRSCIVGHFTHEYIKRHWVHWTQLLNCYTTVVLCVFAQKWSWQ